MVDQFIQYLKYEKRYSDHTLLAYRKDLEVFAEFLAGEALKDATMKDVRVWMVEMLSEGLKPATVNRKLSSLRTFFEWMVVSGYRDSTPMTLIKGPKKEKRLPVFVKKSEMENEHLDQVFEKSFESGMDRLILEMFYHTGIRLSELINLKVSDLRNDHIRVLGKRKKERLVPVSESFVLELNRYLSSKGANEYQESEYIFSLKNGKKLYPALVYRKINYYLSLASDVSKKSPHVLRHTFATHLLNNGAGIEVIKELLGHSGLAATQVYTHNSFAEITKIYSQAHPRGHKM